MRPTIRDRSWWRPKGRPLVTAGRLFHACIAFGIVCAGGAFAGYEGIAVASITAVAGGWVWEAMSPAFDWPHPWGDVLDVCAFEVGQLAGVAVWLGVLS